MAKKTVTLDRDDGLIIGEVGPWASEKHERLRKYIQASHGAREVLAAAGDGWRELHRVVFGRWPIDDHRHKSNH